MIKVAVLVKTIWKTLVAFILVGIAFTYFFVGTPRFGPKLVLKDTPVTSIELSMFSTNRTITGSNDCAQVLQTMRKARKGLVTTSPPLGNLTLFFADGTTN